MSNRERIEKLEREVAELRREMELLRTLLDSKVTRDAPWVPPQIPIPPPAKEWWQNQPTCEQPYVPRVIYTSQEATQ